MLKWVWLGEVGVFCRAPLVLNIFLHPCITECSVGIIIECSVGGITECSV